ncbi:hypothetical protein D3C75_406510 [compost metagenome]
MNAKYLQAIKNATEKVSNYNNYIVLLSRMETLLQHNDFSGVLHTSASIIETIAKDVLKSNSNIRNKSLGSFIDSYKKKSNLSAELFDVVKKIYERRNIEPLSGHGSIETSNISKEEALIVYEVTKMIINIEFNITIPKDSEIQFNSPFFQSEYTDAESIEESILWLAGEDENSKYFDITPFRVYAIIYIKYEEEYYIMNDKGGLTHPFPVHNGYLLKRR